jgi:hypothetical protein
MNWFFTARADSNVKQTTKRATFAHISIFFFGGGRVGGRSLVEDEPQQKVAYRTISYCGNFKKSGYCRDKLSLRAELGVYVTLPWQLSS